MSLQRIGQLIVVYCALILMGLFCVLSPQVFITDSELWSISLGYHFFEDIQHSWVFTRPLFHFLLWLIQLPVHSPDYSVWMARGLFAANGLIIAALLLRISKQVSGKVFGGWIALVLLFGNTGFMNQGFRVRSDLLATTLTLAVFSWALRKDTFSRKNILFFLAPLLATPKGILYLLTTAVAFVRSFRPMRFRPIYLVGALALLALLAYINQENIIFASHYFFNMFGLAYWSAESWGHVFNQLQRNIPFWILFFGSLILLKKNAKERPEFLFFVLASLLTMLLGPGKSQFYIASFLPVLSLQIGIFLAEKWGSSHLQKIKIVLIPLIAFYSLGLGYSWFEKNRLENRNLPQLQTLVGIYDALNNTDITYFDGTCLVPSICKIRHFIGPHQPEANYYAFSSITTNPPDLFLYLNKAALIEPGLSLFLKERYIDLGWGVFALVPQNENPQSVLHNSSYQAVRTRLANPLDSLFGYDLNY